MWTLPSFNRSGDFLEADPGDSEYYVHKIMPTSLVWDRCVVVTYLLMDLINEHRTSRVPWAYYHHLDPILFDWGK
jgi:hypothetical protein